MAEEVTRWLSETGKYFETKAEAIWDEKKESRAKQIAQQLNISINDAEEIIDFWPALKTIMGEA